MADAPYGLQKAMAKLEALANDRMCPELKMLPAYIAALARDAARLDALEKMAATVYASIDPEGGPIQHWVVVDELKRERRGIIGATLRAAIDAAQGGRDG